MENKESSKKIELLDKWIVDYYNNIVINENEGIQRKNDVDKLEKEMEALKKSGKENSDREICELSDLINLGKKYLELNSNFGERCSQIMRKLIREREDAIKEMKNSSMMNDEKKEINEEEFVGEEEIKNVSTAVSVLDNVLEERGIETESNNQTVDYVGIIGDRIRTLIDNGKNKANVFILNAKLNVLSKKYPEMRINEIKNQENDPKQLQEIIDIVKTRVAIEKEVKYTSLKSNLRDAVNKGIGKSITGAKYVKEQAVDNWNNTKDFVGEAVELAGEGVKYVGGQIYAGASAVKEAVVDGAQSAGKKVTDTAKKIAIETEGSVILAGEKINELKEFVGDSIKDAGENVMNIANLSSAAISNTQKKAITGFKRISYNLTKSVGKGARDLIDATIQGLGKLDKNIEENIKSSDKNLESLNREEKEEQRKKNHQLFTKRDDEDIERD